MATTPQTGADFSVNNGIFGGSPFDDGGDDLFSGASGQEAGDASPSSPGAAYNAPVGQHINIQAQTTRMPMPGYAPSQVGPVPGPLVMAGPLGDDDSSGETSVGRTLLLITLGATLGYTQLGMKGLLIGSLWGGAASNAISATSPKDRVLAGTWAVVEGAAAGYLTWQALKKGNGNE
jgi:hypothetical protein